VEARLRDFVLVFGQRKVAQGLRQILTSLDARIGLAPWRVHGGEG